MEATHTNCDGSIESSSDRMPWQLPDRWQCLDPLTFQSNIDGSHSRCCFSKLHPPSRSNLNQAAYDTDESKFG